MKTDKTYLRRDVIRITDYKLRQDFRRIKLIVLSYPEFYNQHSASCISCGEINLWSYHVLRRTNDTRLNQHQCILEGLQLHASAVGGGVEVDTLI